MRSMRTIAVGAALFVLPAWRALATQAERFVWVGPNVKTAIVIGSEQPKYRFPYWGGHAILQRYLMLITRDADDKGGITVPIVKDADLAGKDLDALYDFRIWVGDQPRVRDVLGADLARIDDDGFIIRAVGRDLYICGKRIWGTHWAVYDLLEKYAGCRWYMDSGLRWWMPQEDGMIGLGDIIPRATIAAVPAGVALVEEPSYRMRQFRITPAHAFRQRYRDKFHHNLRSVFDPAKIGASHPEFFPWIDGKRRVPDPKDRDRFQPCVSNPAAVEHAANEAIRFFDENPLENSFSLGMNDTDKFCECDACRAMAPAEIADRNARIAYSFFMFYNQVAERVAEKYPDKRLGCLAYAVLSAVPPGSIKLHPMIVPYLTRDSAQLFDPDERKEFRELVDRWSNLAARMGIYEYIYGRGFLIPRIYNRYLIPNIRSRYGVGVDGFYGECYPNWGLDGPKYWLIDKVLWNINHDPDDLLRDYYSNMFGPVASELRAYFDYLEEVWCTQTLESTKSNYRWMSDIRQLLIFAPDQCDKALGMLEDAEGKVKALRAAEQDAENKKSLGDVLARLDYFKKSFAFTRMMSYRYASCLEMERIAAQNPVPFAEAMRQIENWARPGPLHEHFEAVKALKTAISDISAHDATLQNFRHSYDRSPGPASLVRHFVEDLVSRAAATPAAKAALQKRIDALLAADAAGAGLDAPKALEIVAGVAKEAGFLHVSAAQKPPTLDGAIQKGEWGAAAYSGRFHPAYSLDGRADERTTIYAQADKDRLYLAFDCAADPKVMGADIAGLNTDESAYPKMKNDDSISVSIVRKGTPTRRILVNLNGSLQQGGIKDADARTSQTAAGWQAELSIPLKGTALDPALAAQAPTWLGIARYTRVPVPQGKPPQTACSTLMPLARTGGTIGNGNHDVCMCFVWGPRVIYGGAE